MMNDEEKIEGEMVRKRSEEARKRGRTEKGEPPGFPGKLSGGKVKPPGAS